MKHTSWMDMDERVCSVRCPTRWERGFVWYLQKSKNWHVSFSTYHICQKETQGNDEVEFRILLCLDNQYTQVSMGHEIGVQIVFTSKDSTGGLAGDTRCWPIWLSKPIAACKPCDAIAPCHLSRYWTCIISHASCYFHVQWSWCKYSYSLFSWHLQLPVLQYC